MFIRIALSICLFATALVYSRPAAALSCAMPVFNTETVANAAAIFEGVLIEKSIYKNKNIRDIKAPSMNKMYRFTLKVGKSWTGPKTGDTVDIVMNTYWGDTIPGETKVLIVAGPKKDGVYLAPLCVPTVFHLEHAQPQLEIINTYFKTP